ncbi:class I SAM-dependent methyltransferase [Fructilactobacillus florum]|uniref:class I SAM-dependent methyltransferase n=1 Tax=Fructilactobacillus florum TaxID=640331 RepID=UPI00028E96AA|nr:class I SAM-dependent methyltransferase [Fructilactobacillus florum]EKK20938.1 Adenine-specific methyltransferase [Fructilactobacillus florum 2F]
MTENSTTALFQVFDQSATVLMQSLETSYLDAFIETADNFLDKRTVRVENGLPAKQTVQELTALYQKVDYQKMDAQDIRRAIQMVMIKATKVDHIQAVHQITPDTIADLLGYLAAGLVAGRGQLRILDPAVGSANLLTAVMNQLQDRVTKTVSGFGSDNDASMISVASISAQMQRLSLELVQQDSLTDLAVPQVDLVVSDLPVGYYPIDENVQNYETHSHMGHSYVHHLLMEQAVNQLQAGGFAFFLVPSQLFQSPEAKGLLGWMQDQVFLQGILNLPQDLFLNEQAQKAILIVQKRGADAQQADRVMLGEFPSFDDKMALQKFIDDLVVWEKQALLNSK